MSGGRRKPGLGRGLDALLGAARTPGAEAEAPTESVRQLPVDQLRRGQYQPRGAISQESLQELADSIRAQGVVQPIVVRPLTEGGAYEIIAGERRWRACQLAGLHEIPVVIRDVNDQTALAMALIENIQREDLNPIEEANSLKRLLDEFSLTHQQVAEAVGRSRTAVSNLLRLLALPGAVREMVEQGRLEMGHARALLALDEGVLAETAAKVADKGLSVRETEALVRAQLKRQGDKGAPAPAEPVGAGDVRRLEGELSERLGSRVSIRYNSKGKGRLVIDYNSLDELDGIIARIQ